MTATKTKTNFEHLQGLTEKDFPRTLFAPTWGRTTNDVTWEMWQECWARFYPKSSTVQKAKRGRLEADDTKSLRQALRIVADDGRVQEYLQAVARAAKAREERSNSTHAKQVRAKRQAHAAVMREKHTAAAEAVRTDILKRVADTLAELSRKMDDCITEADHSGETLSDLHRMAASVATSLRVMKEKAKVREYQALKYRALQSMDGQKT